MKLDESEMEAAALLSLLIPCSLASSLDSLVNQMKIQLQNVMQLNIVEGRFGKLLITD